MASCALVGRLRSWCGLWLVFALTALPCAGCGPFAGLGRNRWIAGYGEAEIRARKSDREMLIWYKADRRGECSLLQPAMADPAVKRRLKHYVCCSLFRPYEPDRRYVAQFGVDRAPALVVVHDDGTYHARTGQMSTADVVRFLDGAEAPGAMPAKSVFIHREPRYDWHDDIESAQEIALAENASLLIVFYRWASRDWSKMEDLLERREVYARLAPLIPCQLSTLNSSIDEYRARFGVNALPALVIAHPDGMHHVLEMPTSYEAVVRLADDCARTCNGASDGISASAGPAGRPGPGSGKALSLDPTNMAPKPSPKPGSDVD